MIFRNTLFFVADALKLLLKEYIAPTQANIVLFFLGPIITLIFALLGYLVIPYGPGLSVSDLNLGIIYMLAVSSLSTYGILLAGLKNSPPLIKIIGDKLSEFQEILFISKLEAKHIYLKYVRSTTSRILYNSATWTQGLAFYQCFMRNLWFIKPSVLFFMTWLCFLYFNQAETNFYYDCLNMFLPVSFKHPKVLKLSFSGFSTTRSKKNKLNLENLKDSHLPYIKELYKDRKSPVIPFDRSLIKATCSYCLNPKAKAEFLKNWGSLGCIYMIEYKYNPNIYYIGRTTLFKRRFNNHLKANSGTKLHVFLNLVGWEHFNISIIEECSPEMQGERENFYLQKYLPLLNTTFSSSFSESAIYSSLNSKLAELRKTQGNLLGQSIPTYVYDVNENGISKTFVKYNSITEASSIEKRARGTLGLYLDTNVPFKNKLYLSQPILDFEATFKLVKGLTKDLKLNNNVAKGVWAYDAKTLKLIVGSPFSSKTQAASSIGISRSVITYFIDTWKPEGVKGTYLFSRQLDVKEVEKLLSTAQSTVSGKKVKVWAYKAQTLELIEGSPFASLLIAASYFNVNYRTISRHLDTKLATNLNKTLVYIFSNEISFDLKVELLNNTSKAHYMRTEIWAYKVDDKGVLSLIPNQPFKTMREASRVLGIHNTVLSRLMDSSEVYKGLRIYSSPQLLGSEGA